MIEELKEHNRLNETIFMGVLTIFCFGCSIFRFVYTDTKNFMFLNWNLFLAFIPYALSSIAIIKPKLKQNKLMIISLLTAWLLFFPNAPYILTDLFHLRMKTAMPIWFDLILILSFAWTGLLFGFLSLWDLEQVLKKKLNKTWISINSISLLFIGSFGIYVGRYLRWNTWDIILEPYNLLFNIGHSLKNPLIHPKAWGMTIFMGIFLNIIYWSFHLIRERNA
jgi:uncharacterized membrane protein